MIRRSFKMCGISTANSCLVHNYDFLKRTVKVSGNQTDDDYKFKHLFQN